MNFQKTFDHYWPWAAIILRVALGGLFIFTGSVKIMTPLEEFQAVIQSYQFLPEMLVPAFSVILPITEVAAGVALVFGLFERYAAGVIALMTLSFIIAISAGLARGVSLDNCGCFGPFKFGDGPIEVLWRDGILIIVAILLIIRPSKLLALDRFLK
ncbi:MAG: MauE/DoxX family redox-associated membrane protein [bacterium]